MYSPSDMIGLLTLGKHLLHWFSWVGNLVREVGCDCLRILTQVGQKDLLVRHEGAEEQLVSVGRERVGNTVDNVGHERIVKAEPGLI